MARLRMTNFSCLKSVDISLAGMTILIGPQASGKSVVSKTLYFCYDMIAQSRICSEELLSFEDFLKSCDTRFKEWFPQTAWGTGKFAIEFNAGPITVSIKRKRNRSGPSENITIEVSEYFKAHYEKLRGLYRAMNAHFVSDDETGSSFPRRWEAGRKIDIEARLTLERDLGEAYYDNQLFVPAGRSFFTSIGRAVAAFEHGGILDPLTVAFGKRFSGLREYARSGVKYRSNVRDPQGEGARKKVMIELFGGQIRHEREKDYVEAADGRKVPFSILSSGQQELLPLWMSLEGFSANEDIKRDNSVSSLIYIEEPEAHLFPTAQGALVEYLSSLVANPRLNRSMLITTHSPYVLSKINNLIASGLVASEGGKTTHAKLSEILPRSSWLRPGSVSAYAIVGREVVPIIDEDGLVDGSYLDQFSSHISEEFYSILDVGAQEE